MKKLSAVLMCMVAFLWAAPANAQFKWGLEGGVGDVIKEFDVKNNTWQVRLAYLF